MGLVALSRPHTTLKLAEPLAIRPEVSPKAEQSPESRALTEFKVHLVHLLSTHGELCQDKVRKIFTAYAILTGGISSSKSRNVQARLLSNLDTGDPESYGHKDSLLLVWPAWGKDKCCRTSSI